jgi:hypothetical protein
MSQPAAYDFVSNPADANAIPAGASFFGVANDQSPLPKRWTRDAIWAYIQTKLAAVAISGSASDITTGTASPSILPATLASIANTTYTAGQILYSNGVNIVGAPVGTSGQVLQMGSSNTLQWATLASIAFAVPANVQDLAVITPTTGDLFYFGSGGHWLNLAAGSSGQFLKAQGAGAVPVWASLSALQAANNLSDVASPATSRANLSAANAVANGQTDYISGIIPAPTNAAYELVVNIPYGCTITKTTTICVSGTCTATWSSNGVNLGATNAVSSSQNAVTQSSNNVVTAGKDITLTISANSSCTTMSFTIQYTYALAS